jgi:hypothetical protein
VAVGSSSFSTTLVINLGVELKVLCLVTKNRRTSAVLINSKGKGPLTVLKRSLIRALGPNLQMLLDCGSKIPEDRIQLSSAFFLNAHSSLLPNWRGPSPVVRMLGSNSFLGGVTVHEVGADFDVGEALLLLAIPNLLKDDFWVVQHHISVRLVESFSFLLSRRRRPDCSDKIRSGHFDIRLRPRARAYARRAEVTPSITNLRSCSPSTIRMGKLFCLVSS